MTALADVVDILKSNSWRQLGRKVLNRVYSEHVAVGLRRDLKASVLLVPTRLPIVLRPATKGDLARLLGSDRVDLSPTEIRERRNLFDADVRTAYVGVTMDGQLCCLQWMIEPDQNDRLQAFFRGTVPRLAPDEALVEYAYVVKEFQGRNVVPWVLGQLAEVAKTRGIRWLQTFPYRNNVAVLHALRLSGFVPFCLKNDRWRCFHRRVTWEPLPKETDVKLARALRVLASRPAV